MSSNFFGIEIGLNALRSFRTAQEVTGTNISNVSAPGYTRREAVLQPVGTPDSLTGGVRVETIRRLCDSFALAQARDAAGQSGREDALRDVLLEAEQYLNPLDEGGLYAALGSLRDSLGRLAASPADGSLRRVAVGAADAAARAVNGLQDDYYGMLKRIGENASAAVAGLNAKLREVADLNRQVQAAEASGEAANSLRDQRDSAVNELSASLHLEVSETATGVVLVSEGQMLVSGDFCNQLACGLEGPAGDQLKFRVLSPQAISAGEEIVPSSGELKGMADGAAAVADLLGQAGRLLANLASSGPGTVNAVHAAGYTLSGTPSGEDLFTLDPSGRLQVNPKIAAQPSLLAAAAAPYQGDGDNASALAGALRAAQLDGESPEDFVAALASDLGAKASEASKSSDRAKLLKDGADTRVESVSGVSLDEETSRLLELQTSYAAAAKFISTANSMMDDLLAIIK